MSNSSFPDLPVAEQSALPTNVINQGNDRLERLFGWWYKFTMPPRAAATDSFLMREADRKARQLSTITFFFIAVLLIFLYAAMFQIRTTFYTDLSAIFITSLTIFANRAGKTILAGIILVAIIELAVASSFASFNPLDAAELQLYDLFIIGELLAVSLLPVASVFVIAALNSAFIVVDVLYQAHTPALDAALHKEMLRILIRPIGLQIIVASVLALWVYSAAKSTERANRAEMVATLEHIVSEQRATAEQEKQELEESIQLLVKAHVNATNGQVSARIPYPPAKVLWPLVGVINSLWTRQQHFQQTEQEFQNLKKALTFYENAIQNVNDSPQLPLPLVHTGTDLDPLIVLTKTLQDALLGNRAQRRGDVR